MIDTHYTPSIEDIRVGYECEWLQDPSKDFWISLKITLDRYKFIVQNGQEGINFGIRTPYLTKEQIEVEGWKKTKDVHGSLGYVTGNSELEISLPYIKKGYALWHDSKINIIRISWFAGSFPHQVKFIGKCPSINEFRYICKLLNI